VALQLDPGVYVILVTGYYSLDSAIEAIKRGAYDYVCKPLDYARLLKTLDELAEVFKRRTQIRELEEKILTNLEFDGIVGKSPAMLEVFDLVRKISKHYSNVLLSGPNGLGQGTYRALSAQDEPDSTATLRSVQLLGARGYSARKPALWPHARRFYWSFRYARTNPALGIPDP